MSKISKQINSKKHKSEIKKLSFKNSLQNVCKKYPNLADRIIKSLKVPQLSDFHSEGPKMDSHLRLMLDNVISIYNGDYDDSLIDILEKVICIPDLNNSEELIVNPDIIDYIFLHDSAKPDCLSLKTDINNEQEITWDQWREIEKNGPPFKFNNQIISAISYCHSSEGIDGNHGKKAANQLECSGISSSLLLVISKHEAACQFGQISAKTFKKLFTGKGYTPKLREFILAVSYIDMMATVGINGNPNMTNYFNLIKSKEEYEKSL